MKKFAIIDTFALLHRAWHAIPHLTTKDGRMVNAVYGFTSILLKILKELKPDYVVAAFDLPHETFRHKEYKEYKAQREKPEKDFIDQISLTEDILKALNIPTLGKPGYEADDIIGSLSTKYSAQKDMDVTIVSGDLDTLQLVNDNTRIYTMRRGILDTMYYDKTAVKERYGLKPSQIIDMKALAGDPSDNVPGVKGIGQKGAQNLIQMFGSLEKLYKNIDSEKIKPRIRELLKDQRKEAELSKKLVTIVTDLPIKLDLDKAELKNYSTDAATKIFQELEFRSLLAKLPTNNSTPRKPAAEKQQQTYEVISSEDGMKKLAKKLSDEKLLCVDTETTGLNPLTESMLGASLSWKHATGVYVHTRTEKERKAFVKHIGPLLSNANIKKIGHNIKFDYQVLQHLGITLQGVYFDTLIAAYLLHPNRSLKLEELVFSYLGIKMQNLRELATMNDEKAAKKKNINVEAIDPEQLAQYGAADADMTLRLYEKISPDLTKEKLKNLFADIEIPLIEILARMEAHGIYLDIPYLKKIEKQLLRDVASLKKKIYKHAGSEFNISSPLQLKEILFEKLKIETKGIKRKKTGLSTAAQELEKLKDAHPIIPLITDYRELTKLITTYVTTLPNMISAQDKRIHTSFNQTVTATGRLSSSDPNLQNIPIRTELGRTIRRAFTASKGNLLISADYSQIELRLAAIISKDPKMLESFKKGEDIHRRTAAEVYTVTLDKVTADQRRHAKEVNFGVIYGLGSTGLSQRTGMTRPEAKEFIESYFTLYKGIKKYIEETKSFAHEHGYVTTLFDRKRRLPEIYSSSPMLVAQAERMAINMPLQGTAADLMKLAMIKVAQALPKECPNAKMLLQVHDELVFEIPEDEVKKTSTFVKKTMESIGTFEIPLVVEIKAGPNWTDMKHIDL